MSTPAVPGSVVRRLIVTRPADDAAEEAVDWVAQLQASGWPTQALPLICITAPQDPATRAVLHQQRAHWARHDAILFVSGAAVRHFFAAPGVPPAGPEAATRFWAPGPGTARALQDPLARLGLGADRIDAPPADAPQFDSEALWTVVASQLRPGHRVLIVRGASVGTGDAGHPAGGQGRDWFMQQCERAGARVQVVVAYERHPPVWSGALRAQRLQGGEPGSLWLFSSSEALHHLVAAEPAVDWSSAQALATHPRIAQRARQAGFGAVVETRPALDDVLRALESGWTRP